MGPLISSKLLRLCATLSFTMQDMKVPLKEGMGVTKDLCLGFRG